MRWTGPKGYWASDDRELVNVEWVHAWLSREAYWAQGRSFDLVAKSIEHSLVIGLYSADGTQVGFARFVTDYATFGWLCDVFVDTKHAGGHGSPGPRSSSGSHDLCAAGLYSARPTGALDGTTFSRADGTKEIRVNLDGCERGLRSR